MVNNSELVPMVEQVIYHSHLANQRFISGVYVNIPIKGDRDYLLKIERQVDTVFGQAAQNEMAAAHEILAREIKFILEAATEVSEPVYQKDEFGEKFHVGNSVFLIDRSRLAMPKVKEKDHAFYIDIVVEGNCSK